MKQKALYKLIIALLFTVIFFAQNFSNIFVLASYYTNTKAFAVNCINKGKPQMHCNGKCQMQKKLDDTTNKDKQSTEHKNENGFEVLSSKSFFASVNTIPQKIINNKYFQFNNSATSNHYSEIFHPPGNFFI